MISYGVGLIGLVGIVSLATGVPSIQTRHELGEKRDPPSDEQGGSNAVEQEVSDVSGELKDQTSSDGFEDIDVVDEASNDISDQTTSKKLRLGAAGAGATTEIARRAGIDRHTEAGFVEDAAARAYTNRHGGEVVDTTSSVYAPDGGVDKIIKTANGKKSMQVKHYGSKVGDPILEQHNSEDIIAPTKGIRKNADPSEYESVITYQDWSRWHKLRLEANRVKRGYFEGIKSIVHRDLKNRKDVITRLQSRLAGNFLSSVGKGLISRFTRQPLSMRALIVFVLFGGALWLIWRKWNGEYTRRDVGKWLAAVVVTFILAATIDRLKK